MRRLTVTLAATIVPFLAFAQEGRGVGYPTVEAALKALKAKSGATTSVQGGWTIVEDSPARTIWSFTPSNHPAHPAVVKRTVTSADGAVSLDMAALCEASKTTCDKLIEEFEELNARMSQSLTGGSSNTNGRWQANAAQVKRVELQSTAYFTAKDGRRYKAAYEMLSPALKQISPFESWSTGAKDGSSRLGKVLKRDIKKITWYKNPPQVAPGTYAAVDFSSQFSNANIHCGYLMWHEQGDGTFLIVREEEYSIDKPTEQKLKPDQLEKARAQFRCKG